MASGKNWIVGDLQGCFESLKSLLHQCNFDPTSDHLICAGDLVNRGPASKQILDFMMHSPFASCVLGNHDIFLLARLYNIGQDRPSDTLSGILTSPDRNDYRDWLREQPIIQDRPEAMIVHAGIHPAMSAEDCLFLSASLAKILKSKSCADFLARYFSGTVRQIEDTRSLEDKLIVALRCFVTIRAVDRESLNLEKFTDELELLPKNWCAWFQHPLFRKNDPIGKPVVFGHWAAVGGYRDPRVIAIDTGCGWGRELTAVSFTGVRAVRKSVPFCG
jgi:bis(5'-nucleosyl)-tetraphosphatase (symmetrical)